MYSKLTVESAFRNYDLEFVESIQSIIDIANKPNTITIIDSNVYQLFPSLKADIVIDATEKAKTLDGADKLLTCLSEKKANTKTTLVAIGGGVIQDLVGFCASIYARGIDYILIPTTLLAQADSCVGGKTSINLHSKKNLIGTFYPPTQIVICKQFLETLTKLDYISGAGEIYKFSILQNTIESFDCYQNLEKMIYDSLLFKISILKIDEFDKKERRFLNFGHTFGHAIETLSENKVPHGIAVILGSMIAVRISNCLGYNVSKYNLILDKGVELVKASGILFDKQWFNCNDLLEIVKSDKKSTGKLTMVLIDNSPILKDVENINHVRESLIKTYESI
jgi:3-dehydroquinate synthase